jgi:hypothetical protein
MPYVYSPNIIIDQITIKNEGTGTSVDLISSAGSGSYLSFDTLVLNEDMNEPSMSGSLIVVDNNNFIDSVNLKGGSSTVTFKLTFVDTDKDKPLYTTKTLGFAILDTKVLNDMADQKVSGGSGTPNKILIRFASRSYVYTNFGAAFDSDFIGTISNPHDNILDPFKTEKDPEPSVECVVNPVKVLIPGKSTTIDKEMGVIVSDWGVEKPKSFISKIVSFFNSDRIKDTSEKPLNSDSSYNDVWIKSFNYYYPYFKSARNPLITNILNYVKESFRWINW